MSDWRNELIKDVTNAMFKVENMQCSKLLVMARAALAVAEPVIREQADDALREENARLREENDAWRMDGGSCAEEVKRLREENARLREELQKDFNAMRVFRRYRELEAEIETLRGLLREAHVKMDANNLWSNLRHRVAAAIREGGND